jgi:hypothetical protein
LLKISTSTQEDTQLVKPMARVGTVEVTAVGEGLVSHAGVALLVELADRVRAARAEARARVCGRGRSPGDDHAEYRRDVVERAFGEGAGGRQLQARVGFHPLNCYLDETGEALAAILRPGERRVEHC